MLSENQPTPSARFLEIEALLRVATRLLWLGHALNLFGACAFTYMWLAEPPPQVGDAGTVLGLYVCAILAYELSKRRAGVAAALLVQQELVEYQRVSGRIDAQH
jgi:hypothetical protein